MKPSCDSAPRHEGFSLIEAMIAMFILVIGLLGLAQVFVLGLGHMATSSSHLIAREKAREAIESVHTSRDTHTVTWTQIRNVSAPASGACPTGTTATGGGIFSNGEVEMKKAGADGLVNTSDDSAAAWETTPGPDNNWGTSDDVQLRGFWRQIDICDVNGNADLRQVLVTIRYTVGAIQRTYRLTTFISRFA
jgi:hypothetical protein